MNDSAGKSNGEYTLVSFHADVPIDISFAVPADIENPEKWAEMMIEQGHNHATCELACRAFSTMRRENDCHVQGASGWEVGDQTGVISRTTLSARDVVEGLMEDHPSFLAVLDKNGDVDKRFEPKLWYDLRGMLADDKAIFNVTTGDLYVPYFPYFPYTTSDERVQGEVVHKQIDPTVAAGWILEHNCAHLDGLADAPSTTGGKTFGPFFNTRDADRALTAAAKDAMTLANGYERAWVTSVDELLSIMEQKAQGNHIKDSEHVK